MSELRFTVRPGSAARQAEDEKRVSGATRSVQVRAGSSARMAEDRKRAEPDARMARPGFSLRAQGGSIQRTAAARPAPAPQPEVCEQPVIAPQDTPKAASQSANPRVADETKGSSHQPSAGALHVAMARLRSFFKLPGKSRQSS